jgi:hypothetical protein
MLMDHGWMRSNRDLRHPYGQMNTINRRYPPGSAECKVDSFANSPIATIWSISTIAAICSLFYSNTQYDKLWSVVLDYCVLYDAVTRKNHFKNH